MEFPALFLRSDQPLFCKLLSLLFYCPQFLAIFKQACSFEIGRYFSRAIIVLANDINFFFKNVIFLILKIFQSFYAVGVTKFEFYLWEEA